MKNGQVKLDEDQGAGNDARVITKQKPPNAAKMAAMNTKLVLVVRPVNKPDSVLT